MVIIFYLKSIQPFSFYQCMKGFNTCIIPWIRFFRITSLHSYRCFYILKAQYVRPYTVTTIEPDLSSRLRNILKEKFNPEEPDAASPALKGGVFSMQGIRFLKHLRSSAHQRHSAGVSPLPEAALHTGQSPGREPLVLWICTRERSSHGY